MSPWVFLTELPIMALLVVCWRFNDKVDNLLGLYPLMIALMALIIYLAFYFFRLIEVSWEEIRDIGLFTRRDDAVISDGTALTILIGKRGRMSLALLDAKCTSPYDWVKPTDKPHELAMYRGSAVGGAKAAKRILKYFGVSDADVEAVISGSAFKAEYKYSTVSAEDGNEGREIRIDITATLTANGTPLKRAKAKEDAEV